MPLDRLDKGNNFVCPHYHSKIGIPQGAVISPLLANIYLNLIDKTINAPKNIFSKAGVRIIRYADDFVLIGKKIPALCITKLKKILSRMGLKINEDKTQLIQAKEKPLDFLGFSIRYNKNGNKKNYWHIKPAQKSIHKISERLKEYITKKIYTRSASLSNSPTKKLLQEINKKIESSMRYFNIPKICDTTEAKQNIQCYVMKKINALYKKINKKGSNFINQNSSPSQNKSANQMEKTMHIRSKDELTISNINDDSKDTHKK